jgi:hypothetical protein
MPDLEHSVADGTRITKRPRRLGNIADAEFTDEQLRAALRRAGENAVKSAHAKGLPSSFVERVGGRMYLKRIYPDGSVVIKRLYSPANGK